MTRVCIESFLMKRAWVLVAGLLLSGCFGYGSYYRKYQEELSGLSVTVFANDTLYKGVEFDVTRGVQDELGRRKGSPLAAAQDARLLLEGRVVEYSPREARRIDRGNTVTERQLVVAVAVKLKDRDGKILYENARIAAAADYQISSGGGELEAHRLALRELARQVALGILDRW